MILGLIAKSKYFLVEIMRYEVSSLGQDLFLIRIKGFQFVMGSIY